MYKTFNIFVAAALSCGLALSEMPGMGGRGGTNYGNTGGSGGGDIVGPFDCSHEAVDKYCKATMTCVQTPYHMTDDAGHPLYSTKRHPKAVHEFWAEACQTHAESIVAGRVEEKGYYKPHNPESPTTGVLTFENTWIAAVKRNSTGKWEYSKSAPGPSPRRCDCEVEGAQIDGSRNLISGTARVIGCQ